MKISRRTFIKRSISTVLSLAGISVGSRYYAEYIEPFWIDITNHTIYNEHIPNGFSGTKIVQFSDTHIGFQYQLKDLKKTVQKINELKPHIILFTGDLMDKPNQYHSTKELISVLRLLEASMGKYCIFGNHDHGGYGSTIYQNIMEASDFTMLQNTNIHITNKEQQSIYIAGIDDAMLGRPSFKQTVSGIDQKAYTILLSHAPDFADEANQLGISLQLSGHSHGGQVRIPFYGALITPPYAKKYDKGMYQLSHMQLYVNRGLGTTRLPFRFLTRPEISVFTLQSHA